MENQNPEQQQEEIKQQYQKQKAINSVLLRYGISFGVCLIASFIYIAAAGIFNNWEAVYESTHWNINSELTKNMFILTNATFFTGVLALAFGLLIFAANGGVFEMLVYGIRRFISLFQRDVNKVRFKTFYDYHMYKTGQPKKPYLYLVFVGLFFLGLSAIFLVLYMQNK